MRKRKEYDFVRFDALTIRKAIEKQHSLQPDPTVALKLAELTTKLGQESWRHDTLDEFLVDYQSCEAANLIAYGQNDRDLELHLYNRWNGTNYTVVAVSGSDRAYISSVFAIFDEAQATCTREPPQEPPPEKLRPRVFVGHGRSTAWRDLKDHLQDKHDVIVQAYETAARAGHTIRDILTDLIGSTDFAILVMTGEDEGKDGNVRARQNVIHEAGLFQGKLGFNRAIVLVEEGVEEFSNLAGIQQIRFTRNNIKETFGEVLATLRREFP